MLHIRHAFIDICRPPIGEVEFSNLRFRQQRHPLEVNLSLELLHVNYYSGTTQQVFEKNSWTRTINFFQHLVAIGSQNSPSLN